MGHFISEFCIFSGVPQGSHLGPFLFVLLINIIFSKILHSDASLFADDLRLRAVIRSLADAQRLQDDITRVVCESEELGLQINLSKCSIISFSRRSGKLLFPYHIGGSPLVRVSEVKDLGILISEDLLFDTHFDYVLCKANRVLGMIRRVARGFNAWVIAHLYKTLILPILTCCSVVWRPYYAVDLGRFESFQRKFVRYLSFVDGLPLAYNDHDYSSIMSKFQIYQIAGWFDYFDALFAHKAVSGGFVCEALSDLFPRREIDYGLRNPKKYLETDCKTNLLYNSTFYRLRRMLNGHDEIFCDESVESCKNALRDTFLRCINDN